MPNVNTEAFWLAGWGAGSEPTGSGTVFLVFTASGAAALTDASDAFLSVSAVGSDLLADSAVDHVSFSATGVGVVVGEPVTPPAPVVFGPGSGPVTYPNEYIHIPARPLPPRRVVTRQSVRVPLPAQRLAPLIVVDPAQKRRSRRKREEDELLLMGVL